MVPAHCEAARNGRCRILKIGRGNALFARGLIAGGRREPRGSSCGLRRLYGFRYFPPAFFYRGGVVGIFGHGGGYAFGDGEEFFELRARFGVESAGFFAQQIF